MPSTPLLFQTGPYDHNAWYDISGNRHLISSMKEWHRVHRQLLVEFILSSR
jgi:hypothetical protein